MSASSPVPAIQRAMAIVDFVAFSGTTTPSVLSENLGLAKSTVSDLVTTMVDTGMLQRVGDGLVVGAAFDNFSAGLIGHAISLADLRLLWQRNDVLHPHTLSVQTLIGSRNLCVDVHVGRHLLPSIPRVGMRTELWTAYGGEPILRCFTAADIAAELDEFAGHLGFDGVADRTEIQSWADQHARGAQREPAVAASGNWELNVRLDGGAGRASALTLHLPPDLGDDANVLQVSLARLTRQLVDQRPVGAA